MAASNGTTASSSAVREGTLLAEEAVASMMKITKPRRRAVEPPGTTSRRRRVLHHFLGLSQARTRLYKVQALHLFEPMLERSVCREPNGSGARRIVQRRPPASSSSCLAAQSISTRLEREVSARRRRQRRTQTVSHDSAPRTHVVTALRAGATRTFAPPPRRAPRRRADVRMNAPELCAERRARVPPRPRRHRRRVWAAPASPAGARNRWLAK